MEDGAAASGSRGAMTRRAVLQLLAAAPIAALVPWRPPVLAGWDMPWGPGWQIHDYQLRIICKHLALGQLALTEIARGYPARYGLTAEAYAEQVLALFKSRQK